MPVGRSMMSSSVGCSRVVRAGGFTFTCVHKATCCTELFNMDALWKAGDCVLTLVLHHGAHKCQQKHTLS